MEWTNLLEELVMHGGAVEVAADGSRRHHAAAAGQVLMPGAFNPVHDGHWQLAAAAQAVLRRPVAFELSLANVDKPEMPSAEACRRLGQFQGRATLWITRAATFLQKAELFPQAVFVVGADTAERILQPRYYAPGADGVSTALRLLQQRGCRFLVGCRVDAQQGIVRLADLPIPAEFADLFAEITPDVFRLDISSTQLRRR